MSTCEYEVNFEWKWLKPSCVWFGSLQTWLHCRKLTVTMINYLTCGWHQQFMDCVIKTLQVVFFLHSLKQQRDDRKTDLKETSVDKVVAGWFEITVSLWWFWAENIKKKCRFKHYWQIYINHAISSALHLITVQGLYKINQNERLKMYLIGAKGASVHMTS